MTEEGSQPLSRIATRLGIAGIALAATLGIAACGDDDDDTGTAVRAAAARSHWSPTRPRSRLSRRGSSRPSRRPTPASDVEFSTSFGSSGDQRRAVEAGQPADFVDFSLEPDMLSLVEAGLVAADWNTRSDQGHRHQLGRRACPSARATPRTSRASTTSLTKDVEIITPNPATSGGAKWNIMAIYGSQIEARASPSRRRSTLVATVIEQDLGPRRQRPRLAADVRQRQGRRPDRLRERGHPGPGRGDRARVRDSRRHDPDREPRRGHDRGRRTPRRAQAFLDFILTDEGQQIFADYGYRPVDRVRARGEHGQVPGGPRASSRSPTSAAGRRSTRSSSTTRRARSRRSCASRAPRSSRGTDEHLMTPPPADTAVATPPKERLSLPFGGEMLTRGVVLTWLSIIVLIPLGAVVFRSFDEGLGAFWDAISAARGRGGDQADRDHLVRSSSRSTR